VREGEREKVKGLMQGQGCRQGISTRARGKLSPPGLEMKNCWYLRAERRAQQQQQPSPPSDCVRTEIGRGEERRGEERF